MPVYKCTICPNTVEAGKPPQTCPVCGSSGTPWEEIGGSSTIASAAAAPAGRAALIRTAGSHSYFHFLRPFFAGMLRRPFWTVLVLGLIFLLLPGKVFERRMVILVVPFAALLGLSLLEAIVLRRVTAGSERAYRALGRVILSCALVLMGFPLLVEALGVSGQVNRLRYTLWSGLQNASQYTVDVGAGRKDTQHGRSAEVPQHREGTVYVMETKDLSNPKLNNTAERKIVSVRDDRITVSVRNLGSNYVRVQEFDHEWNLISVRGGAGEGSDYSPPIAYYDFPLRPGKRWNGVSIETNIKTGGTREHRLSAEVGDWETVSVPAGTFEAIKVMIKNQVKDLKTGEVRHGTDTSWYAPGVGRSIKSEMTSDSDGEGGEGQRIVRLLRFSRP